jgi:hypothetical protein
VKTTIAVLPDGFAVGLEQGGRARLLERDVDRSEHCAVHARESHQVNTCVDDGDDYRHANRRRLVFSSGDDGASLR